MQTSLVTNAANLAVNTEEYKGISYIAVTSAAILRAQSLVARSLDRKQTLISGLTKWKRGSALRM